MSLQSRITSLAQAVGVDVKSLQTALTDKQTALTSGTNIKTVNGASLLGSGNLSVGGSGEPTTLALAYNSDNTVNTVTEDGVVKTLSYNADGTVNTISWSVGGGLTRTQTFSYTSGVLTSMTTTEA